MARKTKEIGVSLPFKNIASTLAALALRLQLTLAASTTIAFAVCASSQWTVCAETESSPNVPPTTSEWFLTSDNPSRHNAAHHDDFAEEYYRTRRESKASIGFFDNFASALPLSRTTPQASFKPKSSRRRWITQSLPAESPVVRETLFEENGTADQDSQLVQFLEENTPSFLQEARDDQSENDASPLLRIPADESPADAIESEPLKLLDDPRDELLQHGFEPPLGFAGPSGVLPLEIQTDSHFVPVEDRWRLGFPDWDRSGIGEQVGIDIPYKTGRIWDPYNQNVLKGDYPIIGQHTFLNLEIILEAIFEVRQVPTPTTPFESTPDPNQEKFFGNPNQFFYKQPLELAVEVFHGDAGFKPFDWAIKAAPVFDINFLDVYELGIVNPDVRKGTQRGRNFWALEEWFVEAKLADVSPHYDFVSVRAGSQFFVSDFRGFVFNDTNRGVRLFGTRKANRDQFNLIFFDQTEKDTNSQLNSFDDRSQNTVIANYYRQDFIWPGYTAQVSFHYNLDEPTMHFDENDFLVRPDPVGIFQPHEVQSYYLGWAGDGHINRWNFSHAFYWVLGEDSNNPLAGFRQDINAQMAAIEASIDRDWMRFRTSFFWASGDRNPNDGEAEGFDAIFDEPNFAGGEFSYWQRQAIQLFGVRLVDEKSLLPRLRSSKIEGQTNFVNPGLFLFNIGADADITPKAKLVGNVNFLWFNDTRTLQLLTFQKDIRRFIGVDMSLGAEYRPLLNDNLQIVGGVSGLIPGQGFHDLYDDLRDPVGGLFAGFLEIIAVY